MASDGSSGFRGTWLTVLVGAWLGLAGMLTPGCGYTAGYRLPPGIETIAVPLFDNRTFPLRREVEFDLTGAVRRELQLQTDARQRSTETADAILEGTILSFDENVVVEGPLDSVQESSLSIQVLVRLLDRRSQRVLFEHTVSDQATFSVLDGETLQDARTEAIDEIAERIVAQLEYWD